MATIVTRASNGSALTWTQGDQNLINLNNDKIELTNLSVTDSGGDGSLTYNNTNGVFTYTGPGTSDYRAAFSAGTNISITDGVIANTISAGTGITLTGGVIATTITQYTDSNARSSVSVTDTGGDGSLSYNSSTGVITYTGPGVSDYRSAFSAGTGISITDGVISNTVTDTNTTYTVSAETATGGVNLRLTGSDASTDDVKLAQGSNITLTRTDANTITIAATDTSGVTITDDTTTNATRYVLFDDSTSGSQSAVNVSSTKLTFNPSTGRLTATEVTGSLRAYNEGAIYDLGTTGGTIAPNVSNGNVQKITLNSALTMNAFTSPVAGQSLTLIIYGGTAYTSITSTMKFAGGVKTLTATAGCIDILSVYYDGTTYFASLNKGFA